MSDYKEFKGKDLDDAIQAACKHFDQDRGKLELEIVSGGSAGIFGLVGKKKAVVRARPLQASNIMADAKKPAPKAKSKPKPPAAEEQAAETAQAQGDNKSENGPEADATP